MVIRAHRTQASPAEYRWLNCPRARRGEYIADRRPTPPRARASSRLEPGGGGGGEGSYIYFLGRGGGDEHGEDGYNFLLNRTS